MMGDLSISEDARERAAVAGRALLRARAARSPDFERENRALSTLIVALSRSRTDILATLSQEILSLLGAGSAGISLLRRDGGPQEVFWWPAVAGDWAPFVGGEMPRHASPCGVVVDADEVLLFEAPHEIFPAAGLLEPAITDALLAPFRIDGRPAGTVWALHHDPGRAFDQEDARLLASMAHFASAAYRARALDADRNATQDRLQSLARALPNHAWTAGPDGMLDWFNERVYEYSGTVPPALNGRGWTAIVHPDDIDAAAGRWREALATGEIYETEFRLRAADGDYRWHLTRAVPVKGTDGTVVRWVGTNTDIQDQKNAARAIEDVNAHLEDLIRERTAELVSAQDALRQSQKMDAVGQIAGGIAHDFNNMLAVVLGALNLIQRREKKGEPFDDLITAAQEGAQRAARLTHRLLAFSRQLPLDPEAVDLADMIGSMSELLSRTLGEHVRLETVLAHDLWEAETDANQLENAILNLAINARDSMTAGGRLTIEASNVHLDANFARDHRDVAAGDYVMIAVSDTGTGMTADTLEKAFEPFFTTKPAGKGTGLGLSQVYGYVKQSRGHIAIDSEVGRGTTIRIHLPRAADGTHRPGPRATQSPQPAGSSDEVILLVEDEDRMREIGAAGLRELGYTVIHTASAAQALEILDAEPRIALLLTDVVMPDIGGRQLADEAIGRRPDLRVLFTTGYAQHDLARDGRLGPGAIVLPKPFTLDQIARKVREALS